MIPPVAYLPFGRVSLRRTTDSGAPFLPFRQLTEGDRESLYPEKVLGFMKKQNVSKH